MVIDITVIPAEWCLIALVEIHAVIPENMIDAGWIGQYRQVAVSVISKSQPGAIRPQHRFQAADGIIFFISGNVAFRILDGIKVPLSVVSEFRFPCMGTDKPQSAVMLMAGRIVFIGGVIQSGHADR